MVRVINTQDLEIGREEWYDSSVDGCGFGSGANQHEGDITFSSKSRGRVDGQEYVANQLPQPPAINIGVDVMEDGCTDQPKVKRASKGKN